MRCIGRRSLTLALLLLLHLMSSAKATDLAPLRALVNEGSTVSALVLRLRDGAVLASLNPEQPLIPASVSKLLVAATVLDAWGAAHTFTTRMLSSAPRNGTLLNGDLLIEGAGDP
nr:D-alanyl-D-alanine carboxypeptidase [Candidatus Competibacteraceae bacterium]